MTNNNDINTTFFKQQLLARQSELLQLVENSKDDSNPVILDQQSIGRLSRMDAMQAQAMAQEIARKRKTELIRIEQALIRVKDDEYGYCMKCGEPIGAKRLTLDPSIVTCIGCAR